MRTKIPYISAILPIVTTVILLVLSVFIFGIPLYIPLLFGYLFTLFIALIYKVEWRGIVRATINGVRSISMIFLILLLIGVLIAIWASSGTLDALVYYGLAIIHPQYLIVISFVVSSLVSMLLGTSVGTASTIGVAFMGMAYRLQIDPALVAGAIVSGAFVGDRTSPLSSAANINIVVTKTDYYANAKELFKTLLPAMLVALLFYLIVEQGASEKTYTESIKIVEQSQRQLLSLYGDISLMLLIPPAIIMILSFFRIPTVKNLISGILIGAILAYIFQGKSIADLFQFAIFGYEHPQGNLFGGAWNMFNQVLLIIVAGAFHGLLEVSGILSIIFQRMVSSFRNEVAIIRKTMEMSILSAIMFSTQVMAIIIPGKFMLKYYDEFKIESKILNRMISDSGMVVAGLIPWNLNAILLGTALDIPVIEYIPYAYLLMILPIYSFVQYNWGFRRQEKNAGRKIAKNYE